MRRKLLFIFSLLSIFFILPFSVKAATPCQAIYGGGTTCDKQGSLTIAKTVQNPQTAEFSHNLLQNDYIFSPNQTVVFHLTLTNTSTNKITNGQIQDTIPDNLDFLSGDGSFNAQTRSITIKNISLSPKESKTYTENMKVNAQPISGNQSNACFTNQVIAQTAGFFFTTTQSQDASIFCIQEAIMQTNTQIPLITPAQQQQQQQQQQQIQVYISPVPVQQTKGGKTVYAAPKVSQNPPTGAEVYAWILLIPLFFAGRFLRKIT